MTDPQHPITPPPELVERLRSEAPYGIRDPIRERHLTAAAYCAGADQELEACLDQLRRWGFHSVENLRNARRPKPPSLAKQAIAELQSHRTELRSLGRGFYSPAIDAALERLQQLEQENND